MNLFERILKPNYFLALHVLPIAICFFINLFVGYPSILISKAGVISFYTVLQTIILISFIISLIYFLIISQSKKIVSFYFCIFQLLYGFIGIMICCILLLYNFDGQFSSLRSVISLKLQAGFCIYYIFYIMTALVILKPPINKDETTGDNFTFSLLYPILIYVFVTGLLVIINLMAYNVEPTFIILCIVIALVVLLFILLRACYIFIYRVININKELPLIYKFIFSIALPIISLQFNVILNYDSPVKLGDFSHPIFYILAILFGIIICIPTQIHKILSLIRLCFLACSLSYYFYFFLVVIPFIPFGFMAILLFGVGLLAFTPSLLLVLVFREIWSQWNVCKAYYLEAKLWAITIIVFLLIPLILIGIIYKDKLVFNELDEYIFRPNYNKEYKICNKSVNRFLSSLEDQNSRSLFSRNKYNIPIIGQLYNLIVFDGHKLSTKKLRRINEIFNGNSFPKNFNESNEIRRRQSNVSLTNLSGNSVYDPVNKFWTSTIELELSNFSGIGNREFETIIDLPAGSFVSDYYLVVNGKKETGQLVEKKAAQWVYNEIVNTRKDPGILYYVGHNQIALKVFPFSKNEIRKTGIELVHKEAVYLEIDKLGISLGEEKVADNQVLNLKTEFGQLTYLPSIQKLSLPKVIMEPYLHFVIDGSNGKFSQLPNYKSRINEFISHYPQLLKDAKISFVNSFVHTEYFSENWDQKWNESNFMGGFFLDRCLNKESFLATENGFKRFPVFVILTDNFQNAIVENEENGFMHLFPGINHFYLLYSNANYQAFSLEDFQPLMDNVSPASIMQIPSYKFESGKTGRTFYMNNNDEPAFLLETDIKVLQTKLDSSNKWESAMYVQAYHIENLLNPHQKNKYWLHLLKHSFQSKILSNITSYMVVESDAQRELLQKKQEEVIKRHTSLSLGEDMETMSEPGLWMLFIILILLFIVQWRLRK